ncbi:MAG: PAS domain-containing protein [Spirochaetales bacterium]
MGLWQSWLSQWIPNSAPVVAGSPETASFLVEQTRDLVIFLRTDGTIEAVNPAFSRRLGWADEYSLNRELTFLAQGTDTRDSLLAISSLGLADSEGPLELCDPRGLPVLLHGVFRRVYNPEREAVGGVLLLYDVREAPASTGDEREDQLTSLANRRWVLELLEIEFQRFVRYGGHVAVLWLKLGGPEVDDDVLRKAGNVLKAGLRKSDFCGRIGDRDFLVVLPETLPDRASLVRESYEAFCWRFPSKVRPTPLPKAWESAWVIWKTPMRAPKSS